MKLSIVATLYKSSAYVEEFHARASKAAAAITDDYEIVLVNDGSPDDSLARAIALSQADSHVVVVDLSRNFGHHKAMMTGLMHTKGEHVFLIDSDLEEPPELLTEFYSQRERLDCDVVYGLQTLRKGRCFERFSGALFYRIFNLLSGLALPANIATVRIMTRAYVDALLLHTERELFIGGLWHITGFDQRPVMIDKTARGTSTYSLRKKFALLVNSITSFSSAPLVFIFYVGLGITLFSGLYITTLIVRWAFGSGVIAGWTSLIASIWFVGGMIILFLGVIGIYLSKIFLETKQRPYTIVRKVYRSES